MNPTNHLDSQASQIRQPGVLVLHLLNQCNLKCKHCYMDASTSEEFLPEDLVIRSLNEVEDIEELGVAAVHLSGGEPLLYPYLPKVLDSLQRSRKYEVSISTNGTLIGGEEAALFSKHNVNVQVSIDGPREYHDQFRGVKGAFQNACLGIKRAVDEGVPVSLVTTVCQDNLQLIPWIVKWAINMSIKHITLQPLLQFGRGFNIRDKKLFDSQLCDLFMLLSDINYRYQSKALEFTLAYQTRRFLLAHPCAAYACNGSKCHRKITNEIKKLIIREDGTILPEIPTLNYRFAMGNINEGSLKELVSDYIINGYVNFVQLCRDTYEEIMPKWPSVFVPWDEIISERSNAT